MGLDINGEVLKAGDIMLRYHMSKADQLEVVRILLAVGVEHCLNKQEEVRAEREYMIERAQRGPGMVH